MSAKVELPVSDVIDLAADTFRLRLETMGETDSGAYPFYTLRLSRPSPLVPQETALLDAITNHYDFGTTFYEIGAGVGFLALALASKGYCAVAIESDKRRVDAAMHIREKVTAAYPELGKRFFVEQTRFGSDPLPLPGPTENRIVAVCTNLVNGWSHENSALLAQSLSEFDESIVDVLLFGIKRTRDQVSEVLDILNGMSNDTLLDMNLKGAGYYMRFRAASNLS